MLRRRAYPCAIQHQTRCLVSVYYFNCLEDIGLDNTVVRNLIDAGIHFGHRVGRWNPKMKPYIFGSRNSIYIINIKETIKGLLRAKKFLAQMSSMGKNVLFVGTKRQARNPLETHSQRCGMPFVAERWLGGTLTNFHTIRSRLSRLTELEQMEEKGLMEAQSKKMASMLRRELRKIKRNLDGIRNMDRLPGALVVIDARREYIAINEARKLGIPIVCLLDTDSDPELVDIPIPGNDDAMRAIDLVLMHLADSVQEGKAAYAETARQNEETQAQARRGGGRTGRISASQAAEAVAGGAPQPEAVVTEAAPPAEVKPAEGEQPQA
jgi:small subunit ribosomal protein S2